MTWLMRAVVGFFGAGFLFTLPVAQATPLEAYWHNTQGLRQFAQKSYFAAYQRFLKALENDPFNPVILMNLALTFEVNEEYEKAETAYQGALKFIPENSPMRFAALFNLAGVLGKEKKIPEALSQYQAALALRPDSLEVKTNIELLWQSQGDGGGEGKDDKNKDQKDKGKDKQQPKDGDQDKKDKDKQGNPDDKEQKKQPKPFESRELTPQDVKKILDEIKNQEQSVRANEYERNVKEAPRGKDW